MAPGITKWLMLVASIVHKLEQLGLRDCARAELQSGRLHRRGPLWLEASSCGFNGEGTKKEQFKRPSSPLGLGSGVREKIVHVDRLYKDTPAFKSQLWLLSAV